MKSIAIVGSGPTGAIAAKYLLENSDYQVTIIDCGLTSATHVDPVSDGLIPKKTYFGNAFMYKRLDSIKYEFDKNTSFDTSHALGGLSNVWGANISALHDRYCDKWGIDKEEIREAYAYVLNAIPICATRDMIDDQYDFDITYRHALNDPLSLWHAQQFGKYKDAISSLGVSIGLSKLAVSPDKCIKCSKCMEGCTEGAIFNSADLFIDLKKSDKFVYMGGTLVERFQEKNDSVKLDVIDLKSGRKKSIEFDTFILAAGAVDTSNILMESLRIKGDVKLRESKKFYFPVFSTNLLKSANLDNTISLSHFFIQESENESMVHCQLYSCYHIMRYVMKGKLGSLSTSLLFPFKFILKNFYLAMIYLDSEDSGGIVMSTVGNVRNVSGVESIKSKERLESFVSKMRKIFKYTRLYPIPLYLSSKLGHSQHFGGTFPMKVLPNSNEVDMLGRPMNHDRVFVVDASILPTIPSSPTTTIVMANAIRICKKLISKQA